VRLLAVFFSMLVLMAACGSAEPDATPSEAPTIAPTSTASAAPAEAPTQEPSATPIPDSGDELFPDVLAAVATQADDGSWSFDVTLSSPYDTRERYADGWRVLDDDGNELGIRVLVHDHATEQPFTRSLSGVDIPDNVETVTVQGRDIESGWGGATVEVALTR